MAWTKYAIHYQKQVPSTHQTPSLMPHAHFSSSIVFFAFLVFLVSSLGPLRNNKPPPPLHRPPHLLQPPDMDPWILCQLWVETTPKHISLTNGNHVALVALVLLRLALQPGHDLDPTPYLCPCALILWRLAGSNNHIILQRLFRLHALFVRQYPLHDGRADKHASIRVLASSLGGAAEEWEVQWCLEAVCLPPKVVSVDAHIQPADEFLATFLGAVGRLGEQDETSAGAPCGFSVNPGGWNG